MRQCARRDSFSLLQFVNLVAQTLRYRGAIPRVPSLFFADSHLVVLRNSILESYRVGKQKKNGQKERRRRSMEEKKRCGERLWRKAQISFYRKKGGVRGREKLRLKDATRRDSERKREKMFYRTQRGNERETRLREGTVKLWRMCTRHHQGGLDSAKTCFLGSISLYHQRRASATYRRTVARCAQRKSFAGCTNCSSRIERKMDIKQRDS